VDECYPLGNGSCFAGSTSVAGGKANASIKNLRWKRVCFQHLKLKFDELLSIVALHFNEVAIIKT
jgi:hypothetical protein